MLYLNQENLLSGGGNWNTRRKLPFLSQVTDKRYNIKLYRVYLALAEFELTTLLVICTDCLGILNFGRALIIDISKMKRYTFIFKLEMNI